MIPLGCALPARWALYPPNVRKLFEAGASAEGRAAKASVVVRLVALALRGWAEPSNESLAAHDALLELGGPKLRTLAAEWRKEREA
jgi:hypothetical protein